MHHKKKTYSEDSSPVNTNKTSSKGEGSKEKGKKPAGIPYERSEHG